VQGASFIALVGRADGDSDDSGGGDGFDIGDRPVYELCPGDGEYVGMACDCGGGAVGEGSGGVTLQNNLGCAVRDVAIRREIH